MKLIRVEDTGVQYQFKLPTLEPDYEENGLNKPRPVTEEEIRKQDRINKMLIAQGKQPNKAKVEYQSYLELNCIYATVSGYEYIKMDAVEFWHMINTLNALANIDANNPYGLNLFVCKLKLGSNTEYELVQFEYNANGNIYSGTLEGMFDALGAEDYNESNHNLFFNNLRFLG